MVLKLTLAAGLAALGTAGPLSAESTSAEVKAAKEKEVCRTQTATGSLTRKRRICMTQEQWDELAAQTKKGLDEFSSRASRSPAACDPMQGGRC